MRKYLFILLTIVYTFPAFAQEYQNYHKCATHTNFHNLVAKDPSVLDKVHAIDEYTKKWIAQNTQEHKAAELVSIPVVVHVIYNNDENDDSNISDEQIFSQIEALNRDFRKQNADTTNLPADFLEVAADIEIEFCIAKRAPNGSPTTGITRTLSDKTSFQADTDDVKFTDQGGVDAWPTTQYLNIWVCNQICNPDDCLTLGYSYFPGTTTLEKEGIVVVNSAFGMEGTATSPYNMGRTTVHEAGHFLNLIHVWGDRGANPSCNTDDQITDTPRTSEPNFNCPTGSNQCTTGQIDQPDMIWNYMDYTNDACQGIFTFGQKTRMRAALNTVRRKSLVENNNACSVGSHDVALTKVISPNAETSSNLSCNTFQAVIEVLNFGLDSLYFFYIDYSLNDGEVQTTTWADKALGFGETTTFTFPIINPIDNVGEQKLTITLRQPNGYPDFSIDDNEKITNFSVESMTLSLSEGFQATTFPPNNWELINTNGDETFSHYTSGGYNSSFSTYIDNFNSPTVNGENDAFDDLISNNFSMLNTTETDAILNFYTAYSLKNEGDVSDTLVIIAHDNCSQGETELTRLFGNDLISAAPTASAFTPTANDWKKHTLDLSAFIGMESVKFTFRQIRGDGNNLYLDNIYTGAFNITSNQLLSPIAMALNVYPNPSQGQTNMHFTSPQSTNLRYNIVDKLGRIVIHKEISVQQGNNRFTINTSQLSTGIYFVQLTDGQQKVSKKLTIVR